MLVNEIITNCKEVVTVSAEMRFKLDLFAVA